MQDPQLISVDELRAAGALDVPAKWRKSLGSDQKVERDLFSDLSDESDTLVADAESALSAAERDET